MSSEAKARIKINQLLADAGWRFFDSPEGSANIILEGHTKMTRADMDAFGEDFESIKHGFMDFLLLDERGFPLIVLEAKREEKNPLGLPRPQKAETFIPETASGGRSRPSASITFTGLWNAWCLEASGASSSSRIISAAKSAAGTKSDLLTTMASALLSPEGGSRSSPRGRQ